MLGTRPATASRLPGAGSCLPWTAGHLCLGHQSPGGQSPRRDREIPHVYLVRVPKNNDGTPEVAVLKRVAVPDKDALANMRTEVETMKQLKGHKHIVTYIDSHALFVTLPKTYHCRVYSIVEDLRRKYDSFVFTAASKDSFQILIYSGLTSTHPHYAMSHAVEPEHVYLSYYILITAIVGVFGYFSLNFNPSQIRQNYTPTHQPQFTHLAARSLGAWFFLCAILHYGAWHY